MAYTHRVIRDFVSEGVEHKRGELVDTAKWTWQGKIYVESRGWAEELEPRVAAHYAKLADEGFTVDVNGEIVEPTDVVAEVKEVGKAAAVKKAAPAKKAPAKKVARKASAPTKKASPVKKAVKKSATKTDEK